MCILTTADRVRAFHEAFGHPVRDTPRFLEDDRLGLRVQLVMEESEELYYADDFFEQVDALADIVYVCYGMALEMGVDLDEVIEVVHDANMQKLWPDGKPRYREDGKVIKPEGWEPPDIVGELDRQRMKSYEGVDIRE